MALVFLATLAIVISIILSQIGVHFKVTGVVRTRDRELYAADAGVDAGIDALRRASYASCPDVGAGTQPLPGLAADALYTGSPAVTVECQTVEGNLDVVSGPSNGDNFAIITRGSGSDSLTTQGGGPPITITGRGDGSGAPTGTVYTGTLTGWDSNPPAVRDEITVQNGDVWNPGVGAGCTTSTPVGLSLSSDYDVCRWADPAVPPDVLHDAPSSVPAAAPAPITVSGCRIYFPGKYTAATAPDFSAFTNYFFASGLYYFENVGTMDVPNNKVVVGGQSISTDPASPESRKLTAACATDAVANAQRPGAASGYGVKWIFGGNTRLHVRLVTGMELFTRITPGFASEGAQLMSIQTVDSSFPAGWTAHTPGATALSTQTGGIALTIHGRLYAPTAHVLVDAVGGTYSVLAGGVVANTLALQRSSGNNLNISPPAFIVTTGGPRTIRVKATAGNTAVQAVIRMPLGNSYATRPAAVESWRKCETTSCS
jgi:hypothetical protein